MGVTRLTPEVAFRDAIEALGLDASGDLSRVECLAAAVRRTASFACPATRGAIVRMTNDALVGLPGYADDTSDHLTEVVDALVDYGDLLELPSQDVDGRTHRQLFLGPPGYVRRESGTGVLLVGIRAEGAPILSADLNDAVEYVGHARILRADDEAASQLSENDLIEFTPEQWLRAPRTSAADELIGAYRATLDARGLGGDVELQVLDPTTDVRYYRGRWRPMRAADTGEFVARRSQGFGADLWCFARVRNGQVEKLIDLPAEDPLSPAHDEAWRLQAALDAVAEHPQIVKVDSGEDGLAFIHLFSPVPSWAQRRLGVIATGIPRQRGALFSYEMQAEDVQEEVDFLRGMLWLTVEDAS